MIFDTAVKATMMAVSSMAGMVIVRWLAGDILMSVAMAVAVMGWSTATHVDVWSEFGRLSAAVGGFC